MRAYSIFDDLDAVSQETLRSAGIELTVHPLGQPRPEGDALRLLLEEYDILLLGTSQKLKPEMFANVNTPKLIATASVGVDHIQIPAEKRGLVTVVNTPGANAAAVGEFVMGAALNCCRRLAEGDGLYRAGKNNKALRRKPVELGGRTMGVFGAGNVASQVLRYAGMFGMKKLSWTAHPEQHAELAENGTEFVSPEELAERSDVLVCALPDNADTRGLVSAELVERMPEDAIFICVARLPVIDLEALLRKAERCPDFYLCLDIDVDKALAERLAGRENVYVTPHIAGGTVESRIRMFRMAAQRAVEAAKNAF